MTATAIETEYKGHRFRSRLEARWAVFFDHLKWHWTYEPQGYVVEGQPYLPDFWVDEVGWVEVKGELDRAGLLKLGLAAGPEGLPWDLGHDASTPGDTQRWFDRQADAYESEHGSASRWTWLEVAQPIVPRLVLLGDIPEPDRAFHFHLGLSNGRHVVWRIAFFVGTGLVGLGDWHPIGADPHGWMPHGGKGLAPRIEKVCEAYRAARSARFEHGESGAS